MDGERRLLQTFLADQTLAATETGLWRFAEGHYTDRRIPPQSLAAFEQGWCELAADVILAAPTGGVLGFAYFARINWLQTLAAVFERRGVELPVTELNVYTLRTWGVPLERYPRGVSVTLFVDIHTLGAQARELRHIAAAHDLGVSRIVALVDRHPTPTRDVDGVPFASVLHLPLPLYRTAAAVPAAVRRRYEMGVTGNLRTEGGPLIS